MQAQRVLEHGQVLRLQGMAGWRLECRAGGLMLSGPAPVGDVELGPGEAYVLPGAALVLAEAWGRAALTLVPPACRGIPGGLFQPA